MTDKVLFVDDELNVLRAYTRVLRQDFNMETAESGRAALELIDSGRNYAVIISDMRMPEMDGIELLKRVRLRAPDTVRVMLTGNSDQQTAIFAINDGDVFRFLTKPCEPHTLAQTIQAAVDHHHLLQTERELLEGTLAGAVAALGDTLALVNPEAFGRSDRMKKLLRALALRLKLQETWQLELLPTLSQLGCVILPDGALRKLGAGLPLSEEEQQLHDMHPNIGSNLVAKIPRLQGLAESIRYQLKNFDGSGLPRDAVAGNDIPMLARLLKVVVDFDGLESNGTKPEQVIKLLIARRGVYDPVILRALADHVVSLIAETIVTVMITELDTSMTVAKDFYTKAGVLLVSKGQRISESSREKLLNFAANGQTGPSIEVYLPAPALSIVADQSYACG